MGAGCHIQLTNHWVLLRKLVIHYMFTKLNLNNNKKEF